MGLLYIYQHLIEDNYLNTLSNISESENDLIN